MSTAPNQQPTQDDDEHDSDAVVYRIARAPQRIMDFVVPTGYEVWQDGVYAITDDPDPDITPTIESEPFSRDGLERLTGSPVWIVALGEDARTSNVERALIGTFNLRNQPIAFWVDVAELLDHKTITQLARRGLRVSSNQARRMVAFFENALRINAPLLPWRKVSKQAGAVEVDGKLGFLLGQHAIGCASEVLLDAEAASRTLKSYGPHGDEAEWLDMLRKVWSFGAMPRWLLASSFAAPLLRIVGKRTFVVHHWGTSGSGKTAMAKFASSVWGDPRHLMEHFNRTGMSMTELLTFTSDVCIVYDELQAATEDDLNKFLYQVCLEKGRSRVKRTGGVEESPGEWRVLIRTTGEEPIVGRGASSNLGGLSNRVLQLYGGWVETADSSALHRWLDRGTSYGHGGKRFLEALVADSTTSVTLIRALFAEFSELIARSDSAFDLGERVSHIAIGATAQTLVSAWLLGMSLDEAKVEATNDALIVLRGVRDDADAQPALAERVLALLQDYFASHPLEIVDVNNPTQWEAFENGRRQLVTGFVDEEDDEVWVIPKRAQDILKAESIPVRAAFAAMKEHGFVVQGDTRHLTSYRQRGSFRNRVYVLPKTIWDSRIDP